MNTASTAPTNGKIIDVDNQDKAKTANKLAVYDLGLTELHTIGKDDAFNRKVDTDFRAARGAEGARLHVTLKAISETDQRGANNTAQTLAAIDALTKELQAKSAQLNNLVESFEKNANGHFDDANNALRVRAEAITERINAFARTEDEHFGTLKSQVNEVHEAVKNQSNEHFEETATLVRGSTETTREDIRVTREEILSLVDQRMNHADASFAALRGDVEVVKFLVMDLIKDRIGRSDPKSKPY